jgi:hypothetical protein
VRLLLERYRGEQVAVADQVEHRNRWTTVTVTTSPLEAPTA